MKSNNNVLNRKPKKWVISINGCSADSLEKLKGIGPVLAKRIVAFRSKLGGFYLLTQLNEVYGLSAETIGIILPHFILDTTQIKKIKLNEMGADEMAKHPYLSSNEAKAIVSYRNQHGKFLKLSTLKSLHIFREKSINRLLPYFDLN
jgi:DNA uptake protein ComE-like DNA-binding protein